MAKHRSVELILTLLVSATMVACGDAPTAAEAVTGPVRMFVGDSVGLDDTDSSGSGGLASTAPIVLKVGESVTLAPRVKTRGRSLSGGSMSWRSLDAAVVTASSGGTITGVGNGAALVLQSSGSVTDTLPVKVGTGAAALTFPADSLVLKVGATGSAKPTDLKYSMTYSSLNTLVASVSSTGEVSAKAVGRTTVRATNYVGAVGNLTVVVSTQAAPADTTVTPPPAPNPNPTPIPPGRNIAVTLTRFTTGAGSVMVSSGLPLPPGALYANGLNTVRVFVAGVEQRIYIEALQGKHPDGSLGSVLVQFPYTLATALPISGEVVIGTTRTLADLTKPTGDRGLPDAVMLPSNPTYLVTTNFVGPTITAGEAAQLSPIAAKYDADFGPYVDLLWNQYQDSWSENYYDRGQAYYAQWIRTGNSKWWYRGTKQILNYRIGYLEDASYGTSPHWAQVDGLGLHYQLTGDEKSRFAVGRVAETLRYFRDRAAIVDHPDIEGRILARTLMAQLWGWRLQAMGADAIATSAEITTLSNTILDKQSADGAWHFNKTICDGYPGTLAYMDGMIDEALIQAYTHHAQNSRIPTAVQKSADYIWSQWDTKMQGVKYAPGCPAADYNVGVPELNNLMINGFAWTYARTGNTQYRVRADSMFNAGVRNQFLLGSKQFNQQYSVSFRYLAWRAAR